MDDPSAASTVADVLSRIFRAIWSFPWARTGGIVVYPVRLVFIPVSRVLAFVLAIFAPVGYILAYFLSWARTIAAFLVSLEVRAASPRCVVIADLANSRCIPLYATRPFASCWTLSNRSSLASRRLWA